MPEATCSCNPSSAACQCADHACCHADLLLRKPEVCLQVRLFTSMDLIDTPNGKKILRQYDHTLLAETWAPPLCILLLCPVHVAACRLTWASYGSIIRARTAVLVRLSGMQIGKICTGELTYWDAKNKGDTHTRSVHRICLYAAAGYCMSNSRGWERLRQSMSSPQLVNPCAISQ